MRTLILLLLLISFGAESATVRIKDISSVKGNRENSVLGMGLVIGLVGTGDSPASIATNKIASNLISRLGIETKPEAVVTQSVAVVVVTASMPAFSRNGSKIDVKVSVVGDAKSLAGGTLVSTELKAGDGQVYVVASGQIFTGQATGIGARTFTVASIPEGGVVEREFIPDLLGPGGIALTLNKSDFSTSSRVAEEINDYFKGYYATSLDPSTIEIKVPQLYRTRLMDFIAEIELLKIERDVEALVVLNERTGTVVMGGGVTIQPLVIAHGDLTIQVGDPKKPKELKYHSVVPVEGATVGDLVKSLNALGIKPGDLISIMQGVHAAGALNAKLKLM